MTYTYRNPWAKPYEPQDYNRTCPPPIEYAGCQLFHVLPNQWDTVKAGVCIAQRGGLEGAKHAADFVADLMLPTYQDVRDRHDAELEKSDGQ
jgi:hypothetical protein